jgi:VIT1/CCC1 family predicted Fe2+/Mn2+ transporter
MLIAFGLINVWLLRSGRQTKYRGGDARTMKEEFSVYGLPVWFMYMVGFFKILIAVVMLITVFVPFLMQTLGITALCILCLLMLGAISMHIKVRDPLVKIIPAMGMLVLALLVLYLVTFVV